MKKDKVSHLPRLKIFLTARAPSKCFLFISLIFLTLIDSYTKGGNREKERAKERTSISDKSCANGILHIKSYCLSRNRNQR